MAVINFTTESDADFVRGFVWKYRTQATIFQVLTCTTPNASPGSVICTNTFLANDPVVFDAGTGVLPLGIDAGATYYVSASGLSGSAFSVSATKGGSRLNFSGGSGNNTVVLASSVPIDLTGMTFKMGVRRHAEDATEALSLTTENGGVSVTDELNGRFLINFDHENLLKLPYGIYVHSLIAIESDDTRRLVWTGTLTHSAGPSR